MATRISELTEKQEALWQRILSQSILGYGRVQMLEGMMSDENRITYLLHGDRFYPDSLRWQTSTSRRYPLSEMVMKYQERHMEGFALPEFIQYVAEAEANGVTVLAWTGGGFYAKGFIFLSCGDDATEGDIAARLDKFERDIARLKREAEL